MWQVEYQKVFPSLSGGAVWKVWSDVDHWPEWDEDIEYAKLSGPFVAGGELLLKPRGGPKVSIRLSEVQAGLSFTDVTHFPLARMIDVHELQDTPQGLRLKNSIRMEGPLAWLWRKLVAEKVAAGIPRQMEALARYAAGKPDAP
jgi:hypothetical protein